MPRAGIVQIPMPTYVYKFVKTGETIEVQQSFDEPALTAAVHPRSGRKMAVKKVFTPVGVTFRGEGFYKTDSRKSTSTGASSKSESTSGDSAGSSSTSSEGSSSPTKTADSKASKAAATP